MWSPPQENVVPTWVALFVAQAVVDLLGKIFAFARHGCGEARLRVKKLQLFVPGMSQAERVGNEEHGG